MSFLKTFIQNYHFLVEKNLLLYLHQKQKVLKVFLIVKTFDYQLNQNEQNFINLCSFLDVFIFEAIFSELDQILMFYLFELLMPSFIMLKLAASIYLIQLFQGKHKIILLIKFQDEIYNKVSMLLIKDFFAPCFYINFSLSLHRFDYYGFSIYSNILQILKIFYLLHQY